MVAENRKRVAYESELLKNEKNGDPAYRKQLKQVTARRGTDINKQMEDYDLQREMVEYPGEDLRAYASQTDLEQLEELERLQKYYQDLIDNQNKHGQQLDVIPEDNYQLEANDNVTNSQLTQASHQESL